MDDTIKCEKKNKGTPECDKSTVICNIGIAQYENGTIECEEKKKIQSHVMLVLHNVRMILSNVRKKREPSNVTKL